MRVPLVAMKKAHYESRTGLSPSTDGEGKIIYLNDDGNNLCRYAINKVSCLDELSNKRYERPYEFNEPNQNTWEVVLTEKRITFYNPMVVGIFSKTPKIKKGKSSVGHLDYNNILLLRTGFMGPSNPYISIGCKRYDKTTSYIVIFADPKVLEDLVYKLKERITNCISTIGAGMQEDGGFVEKWNTFFNSNLFDGKEYVTVVPGKKIGLVYNSEISPT